MKYATAILALAAGAVAQDYGYGYGEESSSSTPVKAVVPSTSSAAYEIYGLPTSSTPAAPVIPSTSSAAYEIYGYPSSSSSASSSSSTPAAPVKPSHSTKWVQTVYPSPCPFESTYVSSGKTWTSTGISTSTVTSSKIVTIYPTFTSSPAAPVYGYPSASSAPVAPVVPSAPVAPVKASSPVAPIYPVYGTATSSYKAWGTATGTGYSPAAAQFTGAASKYGAGIALAGAAIVAALL